MEEQLLPPLVITTPAQQGEFLSGILDVLFAFGTEFAAAGIFTREDLAANCGRALEQMRRQALAQGKEPSNARQMPLAAMRVFFSRPVIQGGRGGPGLVPIKGGKDDGGGEPPAAA